MADNFDGSFVEVYSKSTGEKQMIPAEWVDHPVLGADFEQTPSQREDARLKGDPSGDWKVAELKDYATTHGIDLGDAKKHDDILAVITTHLAAAAAGDNEGV